MNGDSRVRAFLVDAHLQRRQFAPVPAPATPQTMDEAYDVQEEYSRLRQSEMGPVVGYKIALTTAVMQQMVGFSEPVAGPILSNTIYRSPAERPAADCVHFGAECEIAFELGRDFAALGGPFNRETVGDGVPAVMSAFELVDDRNADYSRLSSDILSAVADNVFNAGAVLGEWVEQWHSIDLASVRGVLSVNGEPVGEGFGRDVLGHPLDALAWFVNMQTSRGRHLPLGTVVLTGSIVALRFPNPGDSLLFSLEGLGDVDLRMT
jgi:2-keto-4-pentenoate hydratase